LVAKGRRAGKSFRRCGRIFFVGKIEAPPAQDGPRQEDRGQFSPALKTLQPLRLAGREMVALFEAAAAPTIASGYSGRSINPSPSAPQPH
jgi:hypothetical protein